jgi:hypothetical protein
MPKFTDLPNWDKLSAEEKARLKEVVAIKSYKNFDGKNSYSPKEMKKSAVYQESIEK